MNDTKLNTCEKIEKLHITPKFIKNSWERSRKLDIDPNINIDYEMLNTKNLKNSELYNYLLENYEVINGFIRLAILNDLNILVYDIEEDSCFDILEDYYITLNIKENIIGTNSVPLAMLHKKTVVVLKYQHYINYLKDYNGVAAPFKKGKKVIGVVFTYFKDNQLLPMAYSLITGIGDVLTKYIIYKINEEKYLQKVPQYVKEIERKNNVQKNMYTFDNIVGLDEKIRVMKNQAQIVASSDVPVMIIGESGTGKEVLAQSIHNASKRRHGPFIAINCGAIPENLVESELFGYEPGSFTGASKSGKKGLLEIASTGTVFLDEIESMPLYIQIKLLRALSTKKISKVGGVNEIQIDIRIISATKKNLLKESDKGLFREDLYYRISTVSISIPPLRERLDDIRHIVIYILRNSYNIDVNIEEEFFEALKYYYWRGNVRELENAIQWCLLMLGKEKNLTVEYLPERIIKAYKYKRTKKIVQENSNKKNNLNRGLIAVMEEILIKNILEETRYNMNETSKILGISRKTLYSKIQNNESLSSLKKDDIIDKRDN
ncbi:sigma-54 interaction domain-containing protein [Romboutsia sp.]|uniref:sigma-54 interaction domain-containing protein n=1 Tax=Romboutsia sp. TaxID=1965302 RepID=UPI003F3CDFDF